MFLLLILIVGIVLFVVYVLPMFKKSAASASASAAASSLFETINGAPGASFLLDTVGGTRSSTKAAAANSQWSDEDSAPGGPGAGGPGGVAGTSGPTNSQWQSLLEEPGQGGSYRDVDGRVISGERLVGDEDVGARGFQANVDFDDRMIKDGKLIKRISRSGAERG